MEKNDTYIELQYKALENARKQIKFFTVDELYKSEYWLQMQKQEIERNAFNLEYEITITDVEEIMKYVKNELKKNEKE